MVDKVLEKEGNIHFFNNCDCRSAAVLIELSRRMRSYRKSEGLKSAQRSGGSKNF